MIGYHINNKLIANSKGEVRQESPYLDWLLAGDPYELKVFYDLDGSVASLLYLLRLTVEESEELLDTNRLNIDPYSLFYFGSPGKIFGIDKGNGRGHPFSNFYNARQYTDVHYEPDLSPEYAINKAKEAVVVGTEVAKIFQKLGMSADKLTSPVAAFKKAYLAGLNLPILDDIPGDAGELAYNTVKGNWFEAWQAGYWTEAYDWDINLAYGSELAKLLDIRRGRWEHTTEPPKEAVYGFVEGILTTEAPFHPFILDIGGNSERENYTPTGSWHTYLKLTKFILI